MNKKQTTKFLMSLIFAIVLSFACINNVNSIEPDKTIKIESTHDYDNTKSGSKTYATKRVTTTGKKAYCTKLWKRGPEKGDKATYKSKQTSDGRLIYILHYDAPDSWGTVTKNGIKFDKEFVVKQHALWICSGEDDPKSYVFSTEAIKLCKDAKAKGESFRIDPDITSVTEPGTLGVGNGDYYQSKAITVKLKDISGSKYKITFSGAPTGTKAYTTDGKEISGFTTASKFVIRVPLSSVTAKTTFSAKITANTSYHKYVTIYYSSDSNKQPLAVPLKEQETPTKTVKVTVNPSGTTIEKVDIDTEKPLAGAKYKVYSQAGCSGDPVSNDTYTTDSDGSITVSGLKAGTTYYVKEIEPPAGYGLASNSCLEVKGGGSVTFKNKKNSVKLYKQDSQHRNLEGAQFGLYNDASCQTRARNATTGEIFDYALTDSNGTVTFEGMAATSAGYYLYEETPPNGYEVLPANQNCKHVAVNGTVTFINTIVEPVDEERELAYFAVQKRDSYTKFGINGVMIGLFADANCSSKIGEFPTKNGQVKFVVEYTPGTTASLYTKEMQTPSGYIPLNGKGTIECKELKLVAGQNTTIIYNKPYGDIRLLKLDSETKKPIEGIEFALLDANNNPAKDADGKEVQAQKTDAEGIIEFKNILYGTYYIKETASDGKHIMQKKAIKIELNSKNDAAKLKTSSGVTYVRGDVNLDGQVNADDLVIFQNIASNPDLRYSLSPEATYALDINGDGNSQASDIQKDMKILEYYLAINGASDGVSAARQYEQYKQDLCNAVGEANCDASNIDTIVYMYRHNTAVLAEYAAAAQQGGTSVCEDYTDNLIGDNNRDCQINELDVNVFDTEGRDINGDGSTNDTDKRILNNYVTYLSGSNAASIVEIMNNLAASQSSLCQALGTADCSINNSQLNDALSKVGQSGTLPSNVAKSSITITNKPIYIVISKQSISNSKEIPGAKIVIRDAKGNKILEFTSGKKAKKFKLGTGRYTLTEKVAPKGYKTLTTVITFEVLDDGSTKLVGVASSYYKIVNTNHLIIYNDLNDKIIIPDTGSNVAVISIITGVLLVLGGGCLIYKKLT